VSNPIGWVILAIIVLAGLAWLVIANWDKVKTFFIEMWESLTDAFNVYLTHIINAWNEFANMVNEIKAALNLPDWVVGKAPLFVPPNAYDSNFLLPGMTSQHSGATRGWETAPTVVNNTSLTVNGFVGNDQDLAAKIQELLAHIGQSNAGSALGGLA
jgi:hypothetical protein